MRRYRPKLCISAENNCAQRLDANEETQTLRSLKTSKISSRKKTLISLGDADREAVREFKSNEFTKTVSTNDDTKITVSNARHFMTVLGEGVVI